MILCRKDYYSGPGSAKGNDAAKSCILNMHVFMQKINECASDFAVVVPTARDGLQNLTMKTLKMSSKR